MRIGFFCPHSDPLARLGEPDAGGQCVYEAKVATALAKLHHEIRCYTRHQGDKPRQEAIVDGADVCRFLMGPEGFLRKEDMGQHLAEFVHELNHVHGPWLETADVLHGHYWDGGVAALAVSLASGRPLVFTSHSLGALKQDSLPDNNLYHYDVRIPAERRVMAAADRIIALSSVEKHALTERYGIDPEKIRIVPGGVDVDQFAPKGSKDENKALVGIDADFMVFTIGRLDARKGFIELIDCMPVVVRGMEARGHSVCFMLPCGPETPSDEERELRRHLQEHAEALGVAGHIRWFHRLPDRQLHQTYAAADVFVCPSLYEPFGLVLVEAMAAATPVVATCHGGPMDIVSDGEDGYLVDPLNTKQMAARILDVLGADGEARASMGEKALTKARERYAWTAVGRQIAAVYEEIAGEQS
ncbi:MAG: glycosyltransferase [Mariprofundaceae bacterium]